jgi:glucokinase
LGLFSEQGKLLDKWEIETDTANDGKNILGDLAESVHKKLIERKISDSEILGIGMGIPGPVLEDGVVNRCVNLGWGVFNIEKEMQQKTGFSVKAGNDANVAALGEVWQGAAKNHKNSIMVTLGTGVGGGIIIDGKILVGAFGAAGEIGHIKVKDNDTKNLWLWE